MPLSRQIWGVLGWVPVGIVMSDMVGVVSRVPANDNSMSPSLPPGSFLWISRLRHGTEPQRGDVVAFTSPECREQTLFRRVVALEGDYVRPRDEIVPMDEKAVAGSDADGRPPRRTLLYGTGRVVVVPAGAMWVEADSVNSASAAMPSRTGDRGNVAMAGHDSPAEPPRDSDVFGPISTGLVNGRVVLAVGGKDTGRSARAERPSSNGSGVVVALTEEDLVSSGRVIKRERRFRPPPPVSSSQRR